MVEALLLKRTRFLSRLTAAAASASLDSVGVAAPLSCDGAETGEAESALESVGDGDCCMGAIEMTGQRAASHRGPKNTRHRR